MWSAVYTTQNILLLVLALIALGMEGFALLDALRQRSDAFTATGKLTKPIWLGILAVAVMLGLIQLLRLNPLSFFEIIAVVAAGVYLADVRPAVRQISGGGSGPYGPWR
jgi:uncharacterized protein DUF2516